MTQQGLNVDETKPLSVMYAIFNSSDSPLGPSVDAGKLMVVLNSSITGPAAGDNAICTVNYIQQSNDNQVNLGAAVTPLFSNRPSYGPMGGNNLALWRTQLPSSGSNGCVVYSSQLNESAINCMNIRGVPEGAMAVYTVQTQGAVFQLGFCFDGYLRTGAALGTVLIDDDATFVYNGIFSVNTPLQGPNGNEGAARRLR